MRFWDGTLEVRTPSAVFALVHSLSRATASARRIATPDETERAWFFFRTRLEFPHWSALGPVLDLYAALTGERLVLRGNTDDLIVIRRVLETFEQALRVGRLHFEVVPQPEASPGRQLEYVRLESDTKPKRQAPPSKECFHFDVGLVDETDEPLAGIEVVFSWTGREKRQKTNSAGVATPMLESQQVHLSRDSRAARGTALAVGVGLCLAVSTCRPRTGHTPKASARTNPSAAATGAGRPSPSAAPSAAALVNPSSPAWGGPNVISDPKHTLPPYRGPKVEALLGPCVRLERGEIRCIGEPHLPFPNELVRGAKSLAVRSSYKTIDNGCVVLKSRQVACWGTTYFHGPGEKGCRWETDQAYLDSLLSEAPRPEDCPKSRGDFNCIWRTRLCGEPVTTRNLADIAEVVWQSDRVYARSRQGALYCWGDNQNLGCGVYRACEAGKGDWVRDYCQQPQRVPVPPVSTVTWVRDCAVTYAGEVYCWGAAPDLPERCLDKNHAGLPSYVRVGGSLPAKQKRWTQVEQVFEVTPGAVCVLYRSGRIACDAGEQTNRFGGIENIIEVHPPCLRDRKGRVYCWERYAENGPVWRVPGIEGAIAISPSGTKDCALLGDGSLYCWGHRDGNEFGPDEKRQYVPPLPVQFSP